MKSIRLEFLGQFLFISYFLIKLTCYNLHRGREIHEATRRLMSVLLQRLEGFNGRSDNILVCATNRKLDLDAALISRFNVIIKYDLPDLATRALLFLKYAKQLDNDQRSSLADLTEGLSCRSIKDICEQTERAQASDNIRLGIQTVLLPHFEAYRYQVYQYISSHGSGRAEYEA